MAIVDTTQVPGTVVLVDVDRVMTTQHVNQGDSDIVLIPTPSSDPDDPLNWSRRRKLLSTVCVSAYVYPFYCRIHGLCDGILTAWALSVQLYVSDWHCLLRCLLGPCTSVGTICMC